MRVELTSLPPGVADVHAALARGARPARHLDEASAQQPSLTHQPSLVSVAAGHARSPAACRAAARHLAGRLRAQPPAEVPVLGVLFSAPLVCIDPSGQVMPMDMLDFEKEKTLICDSMREARRNLRVRFEHATTDRLRTLVTLGTPRWGSNP